MRDTDPQKPSQVRVVEWFQSKFGANEHVLSPSASGSATSKGYTQVNIATISPAPYRSSSPRFSTIPIHDLLDSFNDRSPSPSTSGEGSDDSVGGSSAHSPQLTPSEGDEEDVLAALGGRLSLAQQPDNSTLPGELILKTLAAVTKRLFISKSATHPTRRWNSGLPTELWLEVVKHLSPADLACLAAVCVDLLSTAEGELYQSPAIRSPKALISFARAMRNEDRASCVRSLTINWTETGRAQWTESNALIAIMHSLKDRNLNDMAVFHNTTGGRFALACAVPATVRTLETSGAFLRSLTVRGRPPLRCLSLRLRGSDWEGLAPTVSTFGETLTSLRLTLPSASPFCMRRDSPVRRCASLFPGTPRLQYLEIREENAGIVSTYPRGHCDRMAGSRFHQDAAKAMPELRHLVWMSAWSQGDESELRVGGRYHETLRMYQEDLFVVLGLETFVLLLSGDRCVRFNKNDKNRDVTVGQLLDSEIHAWREGERERAEHTTLGSESG